MTTAFRPFHVEGADEPAGAVPFDAAELLLAHGLVAARAGGGRLELAGRASLDDRLEDVRAALCRAGLIGPPRGEAMPLRLSPEGAEIARLDRSAVRILGVWVDKVHINGLVPQPGGTPDIWLSRRAPSAEWNPDRFDTLVAGGRAAGHSIARTLAAEAHEEAGIGAALLERLQPAGRLSVTYVSAKGLHREFLVIFDLALEPGFQPVCHDGEITWHRRLSLAALEGLIDAPGEMKLSSRIVCRALITRLREASQPV